MKRKQLPRWKRARPKWEREFFRNLALGGLGRPVNNNASGRRRWRAIMRARDRATRGYEFTISAYPTVSFVDPKVSVHT